MNIPATFRCLPLLVLLGAAPLLAVAQGKAKTKLKPAKAPAQATTAASVPPAIANPVLAGDYPDPSVTKIGNTYWATATTSNWGPTFPLLKSSNLTDWQLVGHVFPGERPAWADYYFWAPEISQDGGRTYVYYTAHKRGGNLSVGVASADRPEGPYRDHGPLVGQPDGSIDGFPMRDEKGQLYLVWKEDGNSQNKPTPIWAQALNADRTALTGEKTELFRNTEPWEGNLVEGPSIVRHDGYFYMFYAANGCCGSGCTYATGVARARQLLGPWEKYSQNPILTKNDTWTCPGHGTAVERNGRWYMLYHAYQTGSFENVGRQGVLGEFTWNKAGWPEFLNNHTTPAAVAKAAPAAATVDEFATATLAPTWQWPVEEKPNFALKSGQLQLTARATPGGAALGWPTTTANYTATTTLLNPQALPAGTRAGLAAHGDPNNLLALTVSGAKLQLWERRAGKDNLLSETALPSAASTIQLRLQTQAGNQYRFAWSTDGRAWTPMLPNDAATNGQFLPPWDRGVRVGLVAQGATPALASFERFELVNK
ncbi:family 43 glycosylhydrolase [Hymenobacter sp. ASUV-10]|uniref:Family 43 glycosylhydrolase n=1 Tax=Hymenobacter aranciens TaxID=3063996 RepID=A0ABT9BFR3_9BACT|nr:family 43 glycosylhydrolase [Hymenobacter sp. ASUV-10]MDO7877082.1 family 43 glycosylhydrolase [Hymenobacter sp. ASUV-10]